MNVNREILIMENEIDGAEFQRILIVDDEPHIVNAVRRVFSNSSFIKVEVVNSPAEALAAVAKFSDLRLVISDFMMPGMDGLELLSEISRIKPEIIRIILTGHADLKTTLRAINEVGVYKFILKPWNNDDLYWTVVRALELGAARRENRQLKQKLKEQSHLMQRIEKLYPGISDVERDADGAIVLEY